MISPLGVGLNSHPHAFNTVLDEPQAIQELNQKLSMINLVAVHLYTRHPRF